MKRRNKKGMLQLVRWDRPPEAWAGTQVNSTIIWAHILLKHLYKYVQYGKSLHCSSFKMAARLTLLVVKVAKPTIPWQQT